jgi:hypothetical protein
MKYFYNDLYTDEYGDFILDTDGDLYIIGRSDALKQMVEHRLQTEVQDLFNHPKLGVNLRQMLGQRLTKEMIEIGKMSLYNLLLYDGLVTAPDVEITAIPLSVNTVVYHILVNIGQTEPYTTAVVVDTINGIKRS